MSPLSGNLAAPRRRLRRRRQQPLENLRLFALLTHELRALGHGLAVGRDGGIDGKDRTALAASLVFLLLNEVEIHSSEDDLTELVLGVAEGKITKSEVAVFLQRHAEGK
jgi:hypothetical protein